MSSNDTPNPSNSKSNLQKFITEFTETKAKLQKATELLQSEKSARDAWYSKSQSLEIINRSLEEENNSWKTNYDLIQKRYDQLQKDLSELKQNSTKGYSMLSYFTSGNIKEENNEMKSRIKLLENEWEIKIKENEQCHVEVFDYKKQFNDKVWEYEETINKLYNDVSMQSKTISELNTRSVAWENWKNQAEINMEITQKKSENVIHDLKNIQDEYRGYKERTGHKIDKLNKCIQYQISSDEYQNEAYLQYNLEILNNVKWRKEWQENQSKFFIGLIRHLHEWFGRNVETITLSWLEITAVFNQIAKFENNKKLMFWYNKIESYLAEVHQWAIAVASFSTVWKQNLLLYPGTTPVSVLVLNKNVLWLIINKIFIYSKILFKLYFETLKHRGHVWIHSDQLKNWSRTIDIWLRKIFIVFSFNPVYNMRHIKICFEEGEKWKIVISEDYQKQYQSRSFVRISKQFIDDIVNKEISWINNLLEQIARDVAENSKQLNIIIHKFNEENKAKFNFKVAPLERLGTSINKVIEQITGIKNICDICGDMKNTYVNCFIVQYHEKAIFINVFDTAVARLIGTPKKYNDNTSEIPYHEALDIKSKWNEYIKNEGFVWDDKRTMMKKCTEWEETIAKWKEKILWEQNENDILRMKMSDRSLNATENSSMISVQEMSCKGGGGGGGGYNEFEDYIRSYKELNEKDYPSLPGKDREHEELYYNKVNEILQRYATKIKSLDVKVAANIHEEEIRKEYDNKIKALKAGFESKEKEWNEQINQKNDSMEGFIQQVNYWTDFMTEYENWKEKICGNCKKLIPK